MPQLPYISISAIKDCKAATLINKPYGKEKEIGRRKRVGGRR